MGVLDLHFSITLPLQIASDNKFTTNDINDFCLIKALD